MHIDDIKTFVRNENEQVTYLQTIQIYSQNIRMEFGDEK